MTQVGSVFLVILPFYLLLLILFSVAEWKLLLVGSIINQPANQSTSIKNTRQHKKLFHPFVIPKKMSSFAVDT